MGSPRVTDGRLSEVGGLAQQILARQPGAADILRMGMLRRRWREIVGELMGRHTLPNRLLGGTLVVSVDNATWSQTLHSQSRRLTERLRQVCPEAGIEKLRFEVDYELVRRLTEETDAAEPEGEPMPTGRELVETQLAQSTRRSIETAAAGIGDPELRERFMGAMGRAMQVRQWCLNHGWRIDPETGDLQPPART
ncbi:MAG: DUF721 domain-containing protein [Armatimonadetes bacterium]|nr:DUF721 domain-containing protein [Armatimonadota bacterium]